MGQRSRLRGDKGVRRLLKQLSPAVKDEMGDVLDAWGDTLLAQMRADVPVKTGELRSRLSKKLSRASLRLRVGFVGKGANRPGKTISGKLRKAAASLGDAFYGRVIEGGRSAQVVNVTRKKSTGPYLMHVRAMKPRPFVFKRRRELRADLRRRLGNFWNNALTVAASGVTDA